MTPIVFNDIARMSAENVDANERNFIAQIVLDTKGVNGLFTLWSCQDYYDPTEPLNTGRTPATVWWLQIDNPYASIVREKLNGVSNADALAMLHRATFPPQGPTDTWYGANNQHMELFTPKKYEPYSHADATAVMDLARKFFPQHPALLRPQCSLYLDVIDYDNVNDDISMLYPAHLETLEAFSQDAAALQYLLRVHPALTVQRKNATPAMEILLAQSDKEWEIFESMGITPDEAYHIMTGRYLDSLSIALPETFSQIDSVDLE